MFRIRVEQWQKEQLVAEEERILKGHRYFKNELLMLLEQVGFAEIKVQGDFTEAEATPEHGVLVFIARK